MTLLTLITLITLTLITLITLMTLITLTTFIIILAIKKRCENSDLSALALHVTLHVLFENTIPEYYSNLINHGEHCKKLSRSIYFYFKENLTVRRPAENFLQSSD